MVSIPNKFVSIAPMMDRTDRHYRYFMRLITRYTLLYTEMITTGAIIYGDRSKILGYSPEEKPLVLQLGGDNPAQLAECARIGEAWGYDEINLNIGCPSPRVKEGNFGACLMLDAPLVAKAIREMKKAVKIPVTVKHRIGVDNCDRYTDLVNFVQIVAETGCDRFTIHARKAWLQGLSPKENRTIPPLRYDLVYQLKQDFPHLIIEINGGITQLEAIKEHLHWVDGVMVGRAAYENPYLFAQIDREIYGDNAILLTRQEVIEKMLPYIDNWVSSGLKLNSISRHLLNLFTRQPGTKAWKRYISEHAHLPNADAATIAKALESLKG
jgi:tRNA-dihydrouridine synthase A